MCCGKRMAAATSLLAIVFSPVILVEDRPYASRLRLSVKRPPYPLVPGIMPYVHCDAIRKPLGCETRQAHPGAYATDQHLADMVHHEPGHAT